MLILPLVFVMSIVCLFMSTWVKMYYHHEYWKNEDEEWRKKYPSLVSLIFSFNIHQSVLAFPYVRKYDMKNQLSESAFNNAVRWARLQITLILLIVVSFLLSGLLNN